MGEEEINKPARPPDAADDQMNVYASGDAQVAAQKSGVQHIYQGVDRGRDVDILLVPHNPAAEKIAPGQTYYLDLELINHSETSKQLRLAARGIPPDVCDFVPAVVFIGPPEQSAQATLTIRPTSTTPYAKAYDVRVTARDVESSASWESSETVRIGVQRRPSIEVEAVGEPEIAGEGQYYRQTVAITNCGNSSESLLLSVIGLGAAHGVPVPDGDVSMAVSAASDDGSITVARGRTSHQTVMLPMPAPSWLPRELAYEVTISSARGEDEESTETGKLLGRVSCTVRQAGRIDSGLAQLRRTVVSGRKRYGHAREWASVPVTLSRGLLTTCAVGMLILVLVLFIWALVRGARAGQTETSRAAEATVSASPQGVRPGVLSLRATNLPCDGSWVALVAQSTKADGVGDFLDRAFAAWRGSGLTELSYAYATEPCGSIRTGTWVLYAGPYPDRGTALKVAKMIQSGGNAADDSYPYRLTG